MISQMLSAHNTRRAKHCAAPLQWSVTAAMFAQHWADTLVTNDCALNHSTDGWYGETLAMMGSALSAEQAVAMWYDEVSLYDFAKPGFSPETGHFSQVVWRGTAAVGCGKGSCIGGGEIWVCEYDRSGNGSDFSANVVAADSNCSTVR
jgi:pathogenesis-related protein 1